MIIKRGKIKRKQSLPSLKVQLKRHENIQKTKAFFKYIYMTGRYPVMLWEGISLPHYLNMKQMAAEQHQLYLNDLIIMPQPRTKSMITRDRRANWLFKEIFKQAKCVK
jgi:hypothetical protein